MSALIANARARVVLTLVIAVAYPSATDELYSPGGGRHKIAVPACAG